MVLAECLPVPLTLFFFFLLAELTHSLCSYFKEVVAYREHRSLTQRLLLCDTSDGSKLAGRGEGFTAMTFKMADGSGYDIFLPF